MRIMSEEMLTPTKQHEISNLIDNCDIKSSVITVSQRNVKVKGAIREEDRKTNYVFGGDSENTPKASKSSPIKKLKK